MCVDLFRFSLYNAYTSTDSHVVPFSVRKYNRKPPLKRYYGHSIFMFLTKFFFHRPGPTAQRSFGERCPIHQRLARTFGDLNGVEEAVLYNPFSRIILNFATISNTLSTLYITVYIDNMYMYTHINSNLMSMYSRLLFTLYILPHYAPFVCYYRLVLIWIEGSHRMSTI